jgi:cytochrome b
MADDAPRPAASPDVPPVRVWDVPTRLVHWSFVALIPVSWWTAESGRLEWHRWSGYLLLCLLLFRIYWGFVGSSTARFSQFVRGPGTVVSYLRGTWATAAGHNPLGALSVVLMLGLLLLQIGLGLIAVDVDGIESGPLSEFVSFETGRAAAEWHESVFNVLMVVILLHLAAVLYYWIRRRQNLVGAMFTGRRRFDSAGVEPMRPGSVILLLIGIALSAGITWAVTRAFQFS